MRISDWSSDVCSSDLLNFAAPLGVAVGPLAGALITEIIDWRAAFVIAGVAGLLFVPYFRWAVRDPSVQTRGEGVVAVEKLAPSERRDGLKRSEEHTSELQSLMRISYAVFCLKKKNCTPQQRHKRP